MCHQSEIEKKKYRNWVKGGLAYKYLKQGLEDFADDVVKKEHKRIIAAINNTAGINCNHCCLRNLQPLHTCKRDHTGKKTCPYGLSYCNCLHGKKQRCPSNICDGIMEEILKSHGSTPPQSYWQNTDIQKWYSEPWQVAKCFINAPGYSDKTKAADIDISGLLHVFINNINLHSHLACSMTGSSNIFTKVRGRRNSIFHSPSMEMEDKELTECVEDIIAILEDTKELKTRKDAQEAVKNLKKTKDLIITTHNEMEVCREALSTVTRMTKGLKQLIQDAKEDINKKQADASNVIDDEIQTALKGALDMLSNNDEIKKLEQAMKLMDAKVDRLHSDYKQRFSQIEDEITALKEKGYQNKTAEKLEYLEKKQKLQDELVKYYKKYFVNTSLTPLKQQQDSINVKEVYVLPEIKVLEDKIDMNRRGGETTRNSKPHSAEDAEEEQDKILYSRNPDVETNHLDKDRYRKMENESKKTDKSKPEKKTVKGYHEIFQTNHQRHKKIYILGDVGTGKSTFCKMMIENWCNAVNNRTDESILNENGHDAIKTVSSDTNIREEFDKDVRYMEKYDLLFFIPLQYMSTFKSDATVDMIKELTKDLTLNTELIDRVFQEDSGRCLIIVDSLDEWRPSKEIVPKPHVSYGIPNGDRANHATVITFSRPSARGILNLKNSEVDQKLKLLGISSKSLESFIKRYISKESKVSTKSYDEFIQIIKTKQIKHVEKTPLLLQQLVWLYCNDKDLGESVSETYCQILNAMCGWSERKVDGNDGHNYQKDVTVDNNLLLPRILQNYPRFDGKERVLFLCGKMAFEMLISGSILNIFGRRNLLKTGLSSLDITELSQFGILNESNCLDTTLEDTQYSFIHMSYLEFFAALYVTTHDSMRETTLFQDKEDGTKQQVLDKLFGTCSTASDVIQLSNVLKLICGLSANLVGDLSKRISQIVNDDKLILQNRRKNNYCNYLTLQIQKLMENCLKECGSENTTMISLSDLCIGYYSKPSLRRIKPNDVISLSIYKEQLSENDIIKDIQQYIPLCKKVQYMYLSPSLLGKYEENPFSLAENVSLINLNIDGMKHCCIDLSWQNQLQTLVLTGCDNIHILHLGTKQLERIDIKLYYGNCASLISLLEQTPLRQLTLKEVHNGQSECYIDLSKNNHLQKLKMVDCFNLSITELNTKQLEHLYIGYTESDDKSDSDSDSFFDYTKNSHSYCYTTNPELKLNHSSNVSKLNKVHIEDLTVDIASLVSLLQRAPLQQLTIIHVNHRQLCEDHIKLVSDVQSLKKSHIRGGASDDQSVVEFPIDLSCQNKLRVLNMKHSGQIKISYINTEQIEEVYIDCSDYVHSDTRIPALEFNISSKTSKLTELHLNGITAKTASLVSLIRLAPLRQLTLINVSTDGRLGESHMHGIHLHLPDDPPVFGIDLSKQNKLQKLKIIKCGQLKLLNINTDRLKQVYIEKNNLDGDFSVPDLDHNLLSHIVIYLESLTCRKTSLVSLFQLNNLAELTLTHVSGDQSAVKGQMPVIHVDLSRRNRLRFLKLYCCNNIRISNLNTDSRTKVKIFNCPAILDFDLLSNATYTLIDADNISENMRPAYLYFSSYFCDDSSFIPELMGVHCCFIVNRLKLTYKSLNHYSAIPVLKYFLRLNDNKPIDLHLSSLGCDMSSIVSLLQQISLRQLTLTDVPGYQYSVKCNMHVIDIDLSKQNQLQELKLCSCKKVKISDLNTEQLEHVNIEYSTDVLDFGLLTNASKLYSIDCRDVSSRLNKNEKRVDLSRVNQLQVLKLFDKNITISDLNTEQLVTVHIGPGILDFDRLLNARKLTELSLKGYFMGDKFQYNKQINDVVNTLHQLSTLTLHDVDTDDHALTVTTEMKSLQCIELYNTNMSLETWCTFVDSLLFLHKSVEVTTNDTIQEDKRDYVRMNPNFDVDSNYHFTFKTKIKRDNSEQTTVSEILYDRNKQKCSYITY